MPNIHKQILNYTGSGYPVVRSNQFKRFADEKWVDANGVLWMRARAFAPPFVETILEPDVREALTVKLPPLSKDAGGAVQYWFLLKARTSFSLQTEQTVTLTDSSDNTQIKTIQYILYLNGRRTGLAELI